MIELTLPWPPSVNHYKKVGAIVRTKSGKLFQQRLNSDNTKMFYYKVWSIVKPLMPPEGFRFRHSETIALDLEVCLHPPRNNRYDIDNRLKVLLDSLMHAKVIADDSQIHRLLVEKMDTIAGGQVVIRLKEFIRG